MNNFNKFYKSWKKYSKKSFLAEDSMPGGAADDMPDDKFDLEQLKMGIEHELEHTKDEKKQKK